MRRVGQVLIDRVGSVVHARLDRPDVRNCIDFGIIEGLERAVEMARQTCRCWSFVDPVGTSAQAPTSTSCVA